MGIMASGPRFEGLVTLLFLLSTTFSTSYTLDSAKISTFSVSTTAFAQSYTENTPVVTVTLSSAQMVRTSSADGTGFMLSHRPKSPNLTETITTHLYTATVTWTINSSHLITTTATAVASNCPTTATTTADTILSAASTMIYTSSTMGPLRHSSRPSATSSGYGSSSHSRIPGSGALSSQSRSSIFVTRSNKRLSSLTVSEMEKSTLNEKKSSGLLPISKTIRATTVRTTDHTRAASIPHFDRRILSKSGRGSAYRVSETGTQRTSTIPDPTDLLFATTLTKTEGVTTITVYTSAITNHITTITITKTPTSCLSSTALSSTPTYSPACISATPNPNPPANDTCGEDGLLEYSSTLQLPNTLEGCAVACLTDTSCLSFTFIPSESTCYTSLYPLADSAFAGMQSYHIYNYDRGCYLCSS